MELELRIKELKAGRTLKQIKKESPKTYYKVQSLTDELSTAKALFKGQFIKKEHLTEYKGLIIWLLRNKCAYGQYLDVKLAMTELLNDIEKKKYAFKTERSIKSIISNLAISAGLGSVYERLVKINEIDLSRQSTLNCKILSDFQDWKLSTLS